MRNYYVSKTATAGPGADSALVDSHVTCAGSRARSQRPALLQAAAETTAIASTSTGKEDMKADCRVRHYKEVGLLVEPPSRVLLWYRSLHVSSSANDSFIKFTGACSRRPHHSHFSHGKNRRWSFNFAVVARLTFREEVRIW